MPLYAIEDGRQDPPRRLSVKHLTRTQSLMLSELIPLCQGASRALPKLPPAETLEAKDNFDLKYDLLTTLFDIDREKRNQRLHFQRLQEIVLEMRPRDVGRNRLEHGILESIMELTRKEHTVARIREILAGRGQKVY
jgi:hypothetical protein